LASSVGGLLRWGHCRNSARASTLGHRSDLATDGHSSGGLLLSPPRYWWMYLLGVVPAHQPRALCGTEPLSAQAVDRPEDGPAELLEPICAVKHKRDRDLLADYSVDGYELRSGMRAAI